jgi:deoxyribodipyrimidine photo-lyase
MPNSLDSLQSRIHKLNVAAPPDSAQSVVYVMSRDCRVATNHAIIVAQQHALREKLPLIVVFVAYDKPLGQRAREHVKFLLDGLVDVERALSASGITFILQHGQAEHMYPRLVDDYKPAAVYFDLSPLRSARRIKDRFASTTQLPVYVVDTHNVVPVWLASEKQEVGARTLRPKINKLLPTYLHDAPTLVRHPYSYQGVVHSDSLAVLSRQLIAKYVSNHTDITRFIPGEIAAKIALDRFIEQRLHGYADTRNDPTKNGLSELSPYLHYGHLSSLSVALAVQQAIGQSQVQQQDVESLMEEMIVRKELADNFCYYNADYDRLQGAPLWAQKTLAKHAEDPREFVYSRHQFEQAQTHDAAWNAAQRQLLRTGKIHGYMRMYWAKKVLEWSPSPQAALKTLLYLNDFYHLDGGDPNGYVGIMWSIAGVHDRPWGERPVYGVIRSMVYNGLKRKFDIASYIEAYS